MDSLALDSRSWMAANAQSIYNRTAQSFTASTDSVLVNHLYKLRVVVASGLQKKSTFTSSPLLSNYCNSPRKVLSTEARAQQIIILCTTRRNHKAFTINLNIYELLCGMHFVQIF